MDRAALAATPTATLPSNRYAVVDMARGLALVAMIAYHFAWDLRFLRLIDPDPAWDAVWINTARAIAGSFLFLVGVSLVLADRAGWNWPRFGRRLAMLAASAAAISVATYLVMPQSFVYFGILHMIAVGSVLALPFLRAPLILILGTAALLLAGPHFLGHSAFDTRWLAWTGLYERAPTSVDFEPVIPWLAPILLGIAATRLMVRSRFEKAIAQISPPNRLWSGLGWLGRWSLIVYLVHQPVLLAGLIPLSWALAPGFVATCSSSCAATGTDAALCLKACQCVETTIVDAGLSHLFTAQALLPEEEERLNAISRQCFAR